METLIEKAERHKRNLDMLAREHSYEGAIGVVAHCAGEVLEELSDKIEGLEADLDSAVEVAYKRGATEWVRMNYPDKYVSLKAQETTT